MKTLGCFFPNIVDATSLYRGWYPLMELTRNSKDIRCIALEKCSWVTLAECDAIFMNRPYHHTHLDVIKTVKRNDLPVWVDFDDDLFEVPFWNPSYKIYSGDKHQKTIAEIIATADIVSVSTGAIAEKLKPLNKHIIVIPNALPTRMIHNRTAIEKEHMPRNLVYWRGSKTHRRDLNLAADACMRLSREFPDVTFLFVGDTPWFADMMPPERAISSEAFDAAEYFDMLNNMDPGIFIYPLLDCPFNRAKSNCSWLEASFAGAATLAPCWPEFVRPGITNYSNADDFLPKLRQMLVERGKLVANVHESWDYINSNLGLHRVNQLRKTILEELFAWNKKKFV